MGVKEKTDVSLVSQRFERWAIWRSAEEGCSLIV